MTRLVRRRDGNPAADTSTSFSDWIQVDDQQLAPRTSWQTSVEYDLQGWEMTEKTSMDDHAEWTIPEILGFVNGAVNTLDADLPWNFNPTIVLGGSGLAAVGGVGFAYEDHIIGPVPGDDDPAGESAVMAAGWRPYFRQQQCPQTGFSTAWRPDWPADAIGYEVEGVDLSGGTSFISEPVSVVVSLAYDYDAAGSWVGTTHVVFNNEGPAVTVGRSGDFLTYSYDWAGFDLGRHTFTDVSLGSDLQGFEDGASEVEIVGFGDAPPYSGLFGMAQGAFDVEYLTGPEATALYAHHAITATATYTVRPPRIRWIYGAPPAYRRTYPNDAITEGARRTYPPTKAIQGGRRTAGAYP